VGGCGDFLKNAENILQTAESSLRAGLQPTEMNILLGGPEGIRMVAASDWPLTSLLLHHGASMGFRVCPTPRGVRVEGRAGSRSCLLESSGQGQAAARLLNAVPSGYLLAPTVPLLTVQRSI